MDLRLLLPIPLLIGWTQGQHYDFCTNGISELQLQEDGVVDVILAQAPLFSTSPQIHDRLGNYFGMYHTSIVFAQGDKSYWTLEFDFVGGSILRGLIPEIHNKSLIWRNDARYCLTKGLLWGRGHWNKTFEVVAQLTAHQASRAFEDLVLKVNSTAHGAWPQYQLWRVARPTGIFDRPKGNILVQDITCGDGAMWVLHYIATTLNVPLQKGLRFRSTATVLLADAVQAVDTSDPKQMEDVIQYFTEMAALTKNTSALDKVLDVLDLLPPRYAYDTNRRVYYRLMGSRFPYVHTMFIDAPLAGPSQVELANEDGAALLV